MSELPSEVWALVLAKMEGVRDFARVQCVCRAFNNFVLVQCWNKKVAKIGIQRVLDGEEDQVEVAIDTALPGQIFHFPIRQFPLLLQNLIQKSAKMTSVYLNFNKNTIEERNQVFCIFLDTLADSPIKIKEFQFENLTPEFLWTTAQSLTRFLNAKNGSLVSLKIANFGFEAVTVPAALLQAFRDCRFLESVEIMDAQPLNANILVGKTQLKSLVLLSWEFSTQSAWPPSVLLNSGASLRQFTGSSYFLASYFKSVKRQKLSLTHPLVSLEELRVRGMPLPTLPWVLFPNLSLVHWQVLGIEGVIDLVCDFFSFWKEFAGEKSVECEMKESWEGYGAGKKKNLAKTLEAVRRKSRARGSLTRDGNKQIILFRKKTLSFKITLALKQA